MARKFGADQLYGVEDTMNRLSTDLTEIGHTAGSAADEQHYDGIAMSDMSALADRLLGARSQVEAAIGMVREYEIHRKASA